MNMQITLLQCNIEWGNPPANRARMEHTLHVAPHSDLYVLPEMWSTGFITNPADYDCIEGEEGNTLRWMTQMAQHLGAALAGSLSIMAKDGTYRNRFYFVTPDSVAYYDKHHLFTYGG